MGKEIVYCDGCGKRLREDDFDRKRAHTVDHRNFCVECKPLPAEPEESKPSSSSRNIQPILRKGDALPPTTPKRPRPAVLETAPPRSKAPLVVGAGVGGVALLAIVVVVASSSSSPSPAPAPVPPPTSTEKPKTAGGTLTLIEPKVRALEAAVETGDLVALLTQCDELRPKVKGTSLEARVREAENRVLARRRANADASRLDPFLAGIRDRIKGDPDYLSYDEIRTSYAKAVEIAGPREAAVRKEKEEYEKSLDAAAARRAESIRAEAGRLATEGKLDEAALKLDDYPKPFRATPHAAALETLRAELEKKKSEAEEAARNLREAVWKDWKVETDGGRPVFHESYAGRQRVYQTHPFTAEKPATLERTIQIPAGQPSALSLWVSPHPSGDWELRVKVDGKELLKQAVGPPGGEWRRIQVDLSAYAGQRVALRLENGSTGWHWEHGFWADVEIVSGAAAAEGSILLLADTARRQGATFSLKGKGDESVLSGWNAKGDSLEWTVPAGKGRRYSVELLYACALNNGGELSLAVGSDKRTFKIASTGGWDAWQDRSLGTVTIPAAGGTVALKAESVKGGLMNFRRLRLVPEP